MAGSSSAPPIERAPSLVGELESLQALEQTIDAALVDIQELTELASSASTSKDLQSSMCALPPPTACLTRLRPTRHWCSRAQRRADESARCH